jgi:hypothetical protein
MESGDNVAFATLDFDFFFGVVRTMRLVGDRVVKGVTCIQSSVDSEMGPRSCALCSTNRPILKRPKTGQQICKECFFYVFETEVHNTIVDAQLFKPGDRVAIGASGGKGEYQNLHRCELT